MAVSLYRSRALSASELMVFPGFTHMFPSSRLLLFKINTWLSVKVWSRNTLAKYSTWWKCQNPTRYSPKFVSLSPENNSSRNVRIRFYFNKENPWDKVKKSTTQNSAKKSAKGNRLTSSQRGLTSTCVIFPNRVQCFSYKTPGYALKFFFSQFREVGKISFCKPNLERLFLEKSLEVNEYYAGYYTATLHLIFI